MATGARLYNVVIKEARRVTNNPSREACLKRGRHAPTQRSDDRSKLHMSHCLVSRPQGSVSTPLLGNTTLRMSERYLVGARVKARILTPAA